MHKVITKIQTNFVCFASVDVWKLNIIHSVDDFTVASIVRIIHYSHIQGMLYLHSHINCPTNG